jgi:hypothetical protein
MARKKNPATARPPAARSAAYGAPAPAPLPATAPAPDSPAGAACAALTANPGGATTAVIADAMGIGRAAARDALTALETAGTVTRIRGGKPGIPDTWTLTAREPAGHEPGTGNMPDDQPAPSSQPGDDPATGDQDGPGEPEAADGAGQQEPGDDQASTGRDPGTSAGQAAPPDSNPADGSPGQRDPADSPAAGGGESAGEPPDPALVAEITGRIEQIQDAASAASAALTSGDLHAALAGLDETCDQASQARRALKAAGAGGRKAPAARPGGLREKVLGHLRDHPGKDFTPHEIHKVLSHSSGAIANALDTLVKHGDAELATEKPRRFRLAGTAEPAGDQAPLDTGAGTEGAAGDTDLAGAA